MTFLNPHFSLIFGNVSHQPAGGDRLTQLNGRHDLSNCEEERKRTADHNDRTLETSTTNMLLAVTGFHLALALQKKARVSGSKTTEKETTIVCN